MTFNPSLLRIRLFSLARAVSQNGHPSLEKAGQQAQQEYALCVLWHCISKYVVLTVPIRTGKDNQR